MSPSLETGWLPDFVYTGDKFEGGLAFFADAQGRISRFSREPADLAAAKRLSGQAALPGLNNGHSQSWHRLLRGRTEARARAQPAAAPWAAAVSHVAGRLGGEEVYDAARMAFMEMMLSGITCVGEFHSLHRHPDGSAGAEPNHFAGEILRAARDTGIRIALIRVAFSRVGESAGAGESRRLTGPPETFVAETDRLRHALAKDFAADEAWLAVAPHSLRALPLDYLKIVAGYAHTHRLRLFAPVAKRPEDNEACLAEHGRRPVALLAELGVLGKRFTAVHAIHLTDDEVRVIGASKSTVCCCPTSARNLALGDTPVDRLLAEGATISLGSGSQVQIDLLEDARLLEYRLRTSRLQRAVLAPEVATFLLQTATVAGARSLGAPGGALEVGRPADFFTVNLFDPSIAGADPGSLLATILFSLERRAIREVWIGARQCLANGRHPLQGEIVGRFVELQRRLWSA